MNTDEIMAMADAFATAHRFRENSAANARRTLKTAIKELVEQAAWAHHNPALLTDADAAADLAGTPRPGAEPVAWGMRRADGLILDVICPDEHESYAGDYTVPLYTTPQASQPEARHGAEPVAYLYHDATTPQDAHPWLHSTMLVLAADRRQGLRGETPLYTAPPQASQPLTDEQLMEILAHLDPETKRLPPGFADFARAIEAAHGITLAEADTGFFYDPPTSVELYQQSAARADRKRQAPQASQPAQEAVDARKPSVVAPLKNAAYEGWRACRRELYALTSATTAAEITNDFERGRHFEAKGIARTFWSMEPEDNDELRSTIGRIAHGIGAAQDTDTQAVLIEGVAYIVPMPVAVEMLRLHLEKSKDAVDAERYRWLRDRFLGTDYAWGHPSTAVWVFETDAPVSVDLGASIDAATAAQKGKP